MPVEQTGLWYLISACILFVGGHLVLSHPPVRNPLREVLGKWGFRAVYSMAALGSLVWMITIYGTLPKTVLWHAPTFIRHGSLTVMLISIFLIVCGVTIFNPGLLEMEERGLKNGVVGILKITRHPVSWGVALWAVSHALASGHLEGAIFFGSFAALSLVGATHIDYRKSLRSGQPWREFVAATSHIPLGAIVTGRCRIEKGDFKWWQTLLSVALFLGLLFFHQAIFGKNVLPM